MTDYFHTWSKQKGAADLEITKSAGAFFYQDSKKILDLTSISFQANWGHGHKTINGAMEKQMKLFSVTSAKSKFDLKDQVTSKLIELVGQKGKIFYTVSGAEGNENAAKMVRQITGRKIIVACQNSYHGATLGALSLTGDWRREGHLTQDEFVFHLPNALEDPDFSESEKLLSELDQNDIAALIWETVSGVNGVIRPGELWWKKMNAWRSRVQAKLILDEVLSGFYRCGSKLAFHAHPLVTPDFVVLSKAITGGHIPFGALFVSEELASFYDDEVLSCGLTSYAHPLGLAACSGVFELMDAEGFEDGYKLLAASFKTELGEFKQIETVKNVRVEGLLGIVEFKNKHKLTTQKFLQEGFYVIVKPDCLIFAPPFILSPANLAQSLKNIFKLVRDFS